VVELMPHSGVPPVMLAMSSIVLAACQPATPGWPGLLGSRSKMAPVSVHRRVQRKGWSGFTLPHCQPPVQQISAAVGLQASIWAA